MLPLVLARLNPRQAFLDARTRILESRAGQRQGSVHQVCAKLAKDGKELGCGAALGMHELAQLAFGLCCFQFFFRQAASSANAESPTNGFKR
jgi:hypothetical protein